MFVMPPRTTEVGRGFPAFRVRNSIACTYSQNLVLSFRRTKAHILVKHRQVRVHRRHEQELLPCPDTSCFTAAGFYEQLHIGFIYAQAARGKPLLTSNRNVHKVRCGVEGSPSTPLFSYSRRKNRAPMFCAADKSQLYTFPF